MNTAANLSDTRVFVSKSTVDKRPVNGLRPTDPQRTTQFWRRYLNRVIARELSTLTRYYDHLIQWLPRREDTGLLLSEIECKSKSTIAKGEPFPDLTAEEERRTAVLLNGSLNHDNDIQSLFQNLYPKLSRTSRLLLVLYNPYFRWFYEIANRLRLREGDLPETFVTRHDLEGLAKLTGFEVTRARACAYFPVRALGIGDLINHLMGLLPGLRWMGLTYLVVLRPVIRSANPGLSCIIPARNERGNIENALKRFPDLGCQIEIIFVEGHSSDGTWEEIQRISELYRCRFKIKLLQQAGKGKADAVRLGLSQASEPLVTILDADLTMPPEMLGRFYRAYCDGHADFINGSRLLYPMEGQAMRFLNRLGNIFFAKVLSWVLDVRVGDSLCGTKLMSLHDYQRMQAWRKDFGDFDPFGDFELLFPAAIFGLGIIDVPVRYLARTYGQTNIRRFSDGLELMRMTMIGFCRIKF
jgi:Glycosyl transferase family 2